VQIILCLFGGSLCYTYNQAEVVEMKTLLLLRHAKSSWKDTSLSDVDRPLNKRGQKEAPFMGTLLHDKELVPEHILSSPAVRCQMTADLLGEACGYTGKVDYLGSYYMAEPPAYFEGLSAVPDKFERVMVIGHNPGLEGLLKMICGQELSMTPAALAYIVLPVNHWKEVSLETRGELVELYLPADVEEAAKKCAGNGEKDKKKPEKKKKAKKDKKLKKK
jgi:phosphohistidine phosphatase